MRLADGSPFPFLLKSCIRKVLSDPVSGISRMSWTPHGNILQLSAIVAPTTWTFVRKNDQFPILNY